MSRALALLLTVVTGTSGLVYEVTWERMLATLLGSHAEATASVLAFFLGGLALGYAIFGAYSRRLLAAGGDDSARDLLRSYGVVEASIGAYALSFELLYAGAHFLSVHGPSQPLLSFFWDALLSAALIVPGAALMGATVPLLTQALARSLDDSTRVHAAVYGLNTLGAFVGALSASFFLIPNLGLVGTLRGMGLVNIAAGSIYVLIASRASAGAAVAAARPGAPPLRLGALAPVALLVGFAMMAVQTALIRLGNESLGASLFTFATVVAVFVLCIAIGSLAVGTLRRVPHSLLPACAWGLFLLLALLYLPLQDAPYWAHRLRIAFRDHPAAFMPYHLGVLVSLLFVIGPAVALSGALLPLIFDRLRREYGELGDAAGRLYGWNTLGSLLGALLGGYALFYWLDLHHVYRVALGAIALAAALLTPPLRAALARPQAAALAAVAMVAVALLPAWDPERLSVGAFRMRAPKPETFFGPTAFAKKNWEGSKIAFFDDDPTAQISVRESHSSNGTMHRSIITNGKSDGSVTGDYTTTAMASLLPAWLAPRAERGFVVGYGTGVTAVELAMLDEAKEVIVAEISPAVIEAAPLFDYANHDASHNPKIRVVRGDAYRVLQRTEGLFDVIASEPSNPWVNGVEMLYSVEFLEAARAKLTPGGVYCQWFHSYETDANTLALVLRTYASVFDHVAVWYALGTDLMLLGFDDPDAALDMPRLIERASRKDFREAFGRTEIPNFPALLAHELWPVGVLHALDLKGPVHTLLHPRLAHAAARAFFVAQEGRLPGSARPAAIAIGMQNSLTRRYAAMRSGLSEGEWAALVRETCTLRPAECVALLASWESDVPQSKERAAILEWLRSDTENHTVNLSQIPALMRLYGPSLEIAAKPDYAELLETESQRYVDYFHHAVPFRRTALVDGFARCAASDQARDCAQLRLQVEQEIGPLDGAR